jgi:hypothetical protein
MRAAEFGWQGLEKGALLDAAGQAGFDLLLTCDQNIQYQENFTGRRLALVILSSNHWLRGGELRRVSPRPSTSYKQDRSFEWMSRCYSPNSAALSAAMRFENLHGMRS